MKYSIGVSLCLVAASFPAAASADAFNYIGFEDGTLGGWSSVGTASVEDEDSLTLGGTLFELDANGQYMAKISPSGSSTTVTDAETLLGLTAGTFDSLGYAGTSGITNFGLLYQELTLDPGEYSFGWAYAAYDYAPYDDGVFFSVSGNGVNDVSILAANVTGQSDTLIVGSYGSTPWQTSSFTITTAGTYIIGFGGYNWGDTGVQPILYIDDGVGVLLVDGEAVGVVTTNIDGSQESFDFSGFADGTLLPVFDGGILDVAGSQTSNDDFTINAAGGTFHILNGASLQLNGSLTGTGAFSKTGLGTLTLTNEANLAGAMVTEGQLSVEAPFIGDVGVASGAILKVGSGNDTGAIDGDIANDGTLIFAENLSKTYTGTITGSGDLTKQGTGNLIMTGTASVGSASVEAGQLTLQNTLTGDVDIASGAVLQVGSGDDNGAVNGDIVNEGDLVFNENQTKTYAGAISGSGDLTKQGTGNLRLTGAATVGQASVEA